MATKTLKEIRFQWWINLTKSKQHSFLKKYWDAESLIDSGAFKNPLNSPDYILGRIWERESRPYVKVKFYKTYNLKQIL